MNQTVVADSRLRNVATCACTTTLVSPSRRLSLTLHVCMSLQLCSTDILTHDVELRKLHIEHQSRDRGSFPHVRMIEAQADYHGLNGTCQIPKSPAGPILHH